MGGDLEKKTNRHLLYKNRLPLIIRYCGIDKGE